MPVTPDPAVHAFLQALDHPLKPVVEALRQLILDASPEVQEGIRWKAPSFRTTDYFATMNLRSKGGQDRVWLILHRGAKVRDTRAPSVDDPTGLLEWLGPDRALVTFADLPALEAKRAEFLALIRAWIRLL